MAVTPQGTAEQERNSGHAHPQVHDFTGVFSGWEDNDRLVILMSQDDDIQEYATATLNGGVTGTTLISTGVDCSGGTSGRAYAWISDPLLAASPPTEVSIAGGNGDAEQNTTTILRVRGASTSATLADVIKNLVTKYDDDTGAASSVTLDIGTVADDGSLAVFFAGVEGDGNAFVSVTSGWTSFEPNDATNISSYQAYQEVDTGAIGSATITWTSNADISAMGFVIAPAGGGTTPVAKTHDLRHDVSAGVADTVDVRHDVSAVAADTVAVTHDVSATAAKAITVRHDITATVAGSTDVVHDTATTAGQSAELVHDISAVTAKPVTTVHDVSATVADAVVVAHDLHAAVGASAVVVHDVEATGAVRATVDVRYDTNAHAAGTVALVHDVTSAVTATVEARHDVSALAAQAVNVAHDVSSAAGTAAEVVHDVTSTIADVVDIRHDLAARAAAATAVVHDVAATVTDLVAARHDITVGVGVTLEVVHDVDVVGPDTVAGRHPRVGRARPAHAAVGAMEALGGTIGVARSVSSATSSAA